MSASNERKKRQAEREQAVEGLETAGQAEVRRKPDRAPRLGKTGRIALVALLLAVVLLIGLVAVLNSDLKYRLPAATVGGTTYSGAEMRYFYMDIYRTLESYELIDTSIPVAEQECSLLEEEGATWHDYIMQNMETTLIRTQALLDQAEADGFTLDEAGKSEVENAMRYFQDAADQNNISLKEVMRLYYGEGVTPKLVEKQVTRSVLASAYEQTVLDGFTYTDEALAAYFAEHIDEYKTYSFMYYFIADSAVPEPKEEDPDEDTEGEDGTAVEPVEEPEEASPYYLDAEGEPIPGPDGEPIEIQYVTDENGEIVLDANGEPTQMLLVYGEDGELALDEDGQPQFQAPNPPLTPTQQFANVIANYATDAETFEIAVDAFRPGDKPGLTEGVLKADLPIPWLGEEEREYGDMSIASGEDEQGETGCYVIMFVGTDVQDYPEVSARHILAATVDEDEDGKFSDAEREVAREKIEKILAEWRSGEQTEERFAEMAEQYSDDTGSNTNGGLYEGIYKWQMVDEFNDFCFAEGRKHGDVGVVHGTTTNYDGYHLIYYVGQGNRHCDELARIALYNADVSAWNERLMEGYTVSYKQGARYMDAGV